MMQRTLFGLFLLVVALLIVLGVLVWPGPYWYTSLSVSNEVRMVRVGRWSGRAEFLSREGWLAMSTVDLREQVRRRAMERAAMDDPQMMKALVGPKGDQP